MKVKNKIEEVSVVSSFNLPTGPETVSEDYTPEGFKTVDDYLKDLRETHELDLQSDDFNRREAIDDKNFAAGNQWDPVVLAQREGLPCLVINSIPQFTAQIVGDWRSNRNAIKVLPSEDGDVDVAGIRSDLIRAIETRSRASRVYDSSFESAVQCGDGAFRIAVEYAKDDVFDQDIFLRPIDDALSVVWDSLAVDPTGRDATHCFVDDLLPRKEFDKRWPETDSSNLSTQTKSDLRSQGWFDNDNARVTEHWRMIERTHLIGLFEDGSVHTIDGDNLEEVIASHGNPTKTRLSPCSYAQMHLVTGFKILAGPFEYKLNRLPIVRMSGRIINLEGKRVRHGLIRFMKDPVRLRNFWRSVAAEQLGYAPKAQWLAPESAVEGREDDFRRAHLSRDPLLVFNDDATAPPERLDPPVVQAALLNEAAVNTQDMKDVTGIHDASLGIKSNETSGKAIYARQREGDIANLTYHDNGNAAILEAGDIINQLISQIYDSTRTVRIIGEDQEAKFIRINDPTDPKSPNLAIGNYDVALATGTSYMTRRVEAAAAMMEAVQVWPEMMQIAGDLVAKAQDWPGAQELSERLKKTIPPQLLDEDENPQQAQAMQQAQQAQQQMMQEGMARIQELETENAELKSKKEVDLAKIEVDWYKARTDRIEALSDHEIDANQMEMDAIAHILEHERADKDREVAKTMKSDGPSSGGSGSDR